MFVYLVKILGAYGLQVEGQVPSNLGYNGRRRILRLLSFVGDSSPSQKSAPQTLINFLAIPIDARSNKE